MATKIIEITNRDNVIDSRDVISRIEYLESEVESSPEDEEVKTELATLEALAEEASGYSEDWRHGATLINDNYFTKYAEELCKDCGDLPQNIPWYIVIDWEETAKHIQADYSAVDFDGETYWIR